MNKTARPAHRAGLAVSAGWDRKLSNLFEDDLSKIIYFVSSFFY